MRNYLIDAIMTILIIEKMGTCKPLTRSPSFMPEIPVNRLTIRLRPEKGLKAVEIVQDSSRIKANGTNH
jgi:hypothetical protein